MKQRSVCLVLAAFVLVTSGCSVFETRDPEDPASGASNWLQPDTPDRVVQNIQTAVADMNARDYLRSLSENFTFEPTQPARARENSLWTGWGAPDEETYFTRLAASSNFLSGHSLQLLDVSKNIVDDERFVVDANYILTVRHSRSAEDIPTVFQGGLVWEIQRSEEGLWYLHRWTDRESANESSWSELKSIFVK